MEHTPLEKAIELFDLFSPHVHGKIKSIEEKYNAKECAFIAVNEIIEAIDWHYQDIPNEEIKYYEQVKTEITNL